MKIEIETLGDWYHTQIKIDGKTILCYEFSFSAKVKDKVIAKYSNWIKGKDGEAISEIINLLENIKPTEADREKFRKEVLHI